VILLKVKLTCEDHSLPVGGILFFGLGVGRKGKIFLCFRNGHFRIKSKSEHPFILWFSREPEAYRRLKYQRFAYKGEPGKVALGIYVFAMLLTSKASDSSVVGVVRAWLRAWRLAIPPRRRDFLSFILSIFVRIAESDYLHAAVTLCLSDCMALSLSTLFINACPNPCQKCK
jgi:hypothetical protein